MKRKDLKEQLLRDPDRRHKDGCEGQYFEPHTCSNDIHMNEVIFTRGHIRHLTAKQKEYFWHEINCSLVCGWFHENYGHSKRFRNYWVNHVIIKYEVKEVAEYLKNAPLKVKDYNFVYELFDERNKDETN